MLLEPGGYITPHVDSDINKLSPVNVALNTPTNCLFKMKDHDGYVPLYAGKALLLDVGNVHAVYNNSNEDRYHLIIHGKPNAEFKKLVERSYINALK
jgi:aspartyl/asparaginyl beta-hydroxylase (cupin superfamily)